MQAQPWADDHGVEHVALDLLDDEDRAADDHRRVDAPRDEGHEHRGRTGDHGADDREERGQPGEHDQGQRQRDADQQQHDPDDDGVDGGDEDDAADVGAQRAPR
ncbi:MAG TPA: hypothetical protein VF533_21225, partial [Solirubrobacteraceae bacterium]